MPNEQRAPAMPSRRGDPLQEPRQHGSEERHKKPRHPLGLSACACEKLSTELGDKSVEKKLETKQQRGKEVVII